MRDWYGYWDSLAKAGGCVSAEVQALDNIRMDANPMSTGHAVMAIAFSNRLVGDQALHQNPVGITVLPVADAGDLRGCSIRPAAIRGGE